MKTTSLWNKPATESRVAITNAAKRNEVVVGSCKVAIDREVMVRLISSAFVSELCERLTKTEFLSVCRRNAKETDPLVCHSHDFCDANMAMEAAMTSLGVELWTADGEISDEATALWNDAWAAARPALSMR